MRAVNNATVEQLLASGRANSTVVVANATQRAFHLKQAAKAQGYRQARGDTRGSGMVLRTELNFHGFSSYIFEIPWIFVTFPISTPRCSVRAYSPQPGGGHGRPRPRERGAEAPLPRAQGAQPGPAAESRRGSDW